MLEMRNIILCLAQNDRQLIENFNFTLNRGDKAVIIGEEDNGKSTLLKLIHDRRSVESYCICEGSIVAKGTIAYLPQTLPEDLDHSTVSAFFSGTDIQLQPDISAQMAIPLRFFLRSAHPNSFRR